MELKSVLLLLSVVAATSFAQEKCCFPDQFEILQTQVAGTIQAGQGLVVTDVIQAAFDYPNKRQAGLITQYTQGQVQNYQVVSDYNKGVSYVIIDNQKTCLKNPLPGNMTHCVPDDATSAGSAYFGDHKVTADIFTYFQKVENFEGNVTLLVTQGNCIPFGVTLVGNQGGAPVLATDGYTGYTKGIKDPSKYFTIPSYCPQSFSAFNMPLPKIL